MNRAGSPAGRPALLGTKLQRLEHVDTFWFAWAAFLPDTKVVPPAR